MIFYYVYPSAFQNPGGGEVLLLKTKESVEKLGTKITLFNMWQDRLSASDVLHVFGSVKEALGLMETAKAIGTKIIQSPIVWYDWLSAAGVVYPPKERFLCLMRQLVKTLLPIVPSPRKRMMELADFVLAGSEMEAKQIARYFLIPKSKIKVVNYGTDEYFLTAQPNLFFEKYGFQNFILCVGRIEPRKNQLHLIRAVNGMSKDLVLIGDPVSHHTAYYEQCRKEAGKNVHFLGSLQRDSEELRSAFSACDVFALPSWFETPGLAALEAGLAGAKIVITTGGCTREYFQDMAEYVNPGNISDIRRKIEKVMNEKKTDRLKNHIQAKYLWKHMAKQTIDIYNLMINC